MKYLLTYIRSFMLKTNLRRSFRLSIWFAASPRYQAEGADDLSIVAKPRARAGALISMANRRCRQSGTLMPQQPNGASGPRLYLSGSATAFKLEWCGLSYRRTIAAVLPRECLIAKEAAATITQGGARRTGRSPSENTWVATEVW
jgi:hypothetical protein